MAQTHAQKETGIAIGLTLIGFVLIAGLQHFYLGKIWKGILWFLTGGLFFIGTIVDLFTMSGQVAKVNSRIS